MKAPSFAMCEKPRIKQYLSQRLREKRKRMGMATGGGKATHAGTDYQNRSAAWIAVLILAERDSALPLGLPAGVTLESIGCETEQPVDDSLVDTSVSGHLFFQSKHTIDLETKEGSEFASVVDQFVRQYLHARISAPGVLPLGGTLDPDRDRLMLATSSKSSAPLRVDLSTILRRLRELSPHRKGGSRQKRDGIGKADAALDLVEGGAIEPGRGGGKRILAICMGNRNGGTPLRLKPKGAVLTALVQHPWQLARPSWSVTDIRNRRRTYHNRITCLHLFV
jgi:hypothetical protein